MSSLPIHLHRRRSGLWPITLLLTALLTACGGGGSGGDAVEAQAPAFTAQPASSVTQAGGVVTFTVSVSGTNVTFQWQRSVDAGLTWLDVLAATAASYTISALDASMNGYQYRAVAKSGDVVVTSSPATLSVSSPTVAGAPYDISVDGPGKIYIAALPNASTTVNQWASYVQTVDATTGNVFTLAGSAVQGYVNAVGAAAQFNGVENLVADGRGAVYVSDFGNSVIRKVAADGTVTTFAGNGTVGRTDGPRTSASFVGVRGLAFDAAGNLYVADQFGYNIRKIATDGTVSTLAGGTVAGSADGVGSAARFSGPVGVAVGPDGNVYVADGTNGIRKVTPTGAVSTLTDAVGDAVGIAVDAAGNVFCTSWTQNKVYKVSPAGIASVFAGSDAGGFTDGTGSAAKFATPFAVAVDSAGNVFVADTGNRAVRKITAAGVVSTLVR